MKNINNYKNVHLIGIGGASMYAIAAQLFSDGIHVTGSDISESHNTEYLKNMGIEIAIPHNIDLVKKADLVIYTAAISSQDVELVCARDNNIKTVERAKFLGEYTKDYENLICISGTHGKSTTTSMIASIFLEAKLNPTIQIGASLKKINGNYFIGGKKYFILEACEYVDSFLNFRPTSEVILNIDNDHLDYFGNLDNIKKSFKKYVNLLPDNGHLVINADDKNTQGLSDGIKNVITYGIDNENAIIKAQNIQFSNLGFPTFDVFIKNKYFETITLSVLGYHNILNALAAIGISISYDIDKDVIKKALKEFGGVGRRFEYLGEYKGVQIFDDFAHHPTEILTTYNSSLNVKHNKCWAVFQSHTYSRTYEHLEAFSDVLSKFDNIIICDIYPAREVNTWNVKESDLVDLIAKKNKNVIHIPNYQEIANYLKDHIHEGDIIITIGAGPINKVADIILSENK